MRLLPGYATAPSPAKAVVVHRPVTRATIAVFVDTVAFELVPILPTQARATADLMRARTALELYSSVSRINEPSTGMLNVVG